MDLTHHLKRLSRPDKALGEALDRRFQQFQDTSLQEMRAIAGDQRERLEWLQRESRRLSDELESLHNDMQARQLESQGATQQVLDIVKAGYDNAGELTKKLHDLRTSERYKKAFEEKDPLITVRIATYNRSDLLINTAIRSVLNQSYQNFEIVVVGDHCTDDTEQRIAALNDRRIRFINLPNRSYYPNDKIHRWYVGGAQAMNEAAWQGAGTWIAPLDDDDDFTPDHLEVLLGVVKKEKCEMAYGAIDQVNQLNGEVRHIWSDPPVLGNFSFQAALYLKSLDFFHYDVASWAMREPGDWNLCRRMQLAGVHIKGIDKGIGTLHYVPVTDQSHI